MITEKVVGMNVEIAECVTKDKPDDGLRIELSKSETV